MTRDEDHDFDEFEVKKAENEHDIVFVWGNGARDKKMLM